MPRTNSQDHSTGDSITSSKLNDINSDIDDIYSEGSDRLRVFPSISGSPLKIDVGAGTYFVGSSRGIYGGGTDIDLTDDSTNYVMIDTGGSIQLSTSGWNDDHARLAIVVCASGVITSIELHKTDAYGGNIGAPITRKTITASQTIVPGEGYIVNSGSLVTLTLPTTSAVGQRFAVIGIGSGGWKIAQNASQSMIFDSLSSTVGTGGFLESTEDNQFVMLECIEANEKWNISGFTGSPQFNGTDKKITQAIIDSHLGTEAQVLAGTSSKLIGSLLDIKEVYGHDTGDINGNYSGSGATVSYAHGMDKPPMLILFFCVGYIMVSTGYRGSDGSKGCMYHQTGSGNTKGMTGSYPIYLHKSSGSFASGSVTVDATNINITRSSATGEDGIDFRAVCLA